MRLHISAFVVSSLLVASAASAAGTVDATKPWSARMADSIMIRQPRGVLIENPGNAAPKWSYSTAFCVRAVTQVGVGKGAAGEPYVKYGKDYMDAFIAPDGTIGKAYDPKGYRLDDIAPGQLILMLYGETHDERYKKAALQLAEQLKTQPRVEGGGFWHKQIYPHQMWLDGIFMDCPFISRLGSINAQPAYFDEAATQILLLASHAQDPATGLCYHGWDESKAERWSDPRTGLSKNFWGRGMGWYMAGIVETLDYMPENHPKRAAILDVLKKAAAGIEKVQDAKTGTWYQVLDKGDQPGNYHEASASSMFVYVLAKAARKGYIDRHFADVAKKGYQGILSTLITVDASGVVTLNDTCAVAGLGASPYRDGSYEYYLSEKRVPNDPKGLAPFILASLELEENK